MCVIVCMSWFFVCLFCFFVFFLFFFFFFVFFFFEVLQKALVLVDALLDFAICVYNALVLVGVWFIFVLFFWQRLLAARMQQASALRAPGGIR